MKASTIDAQNRPAILSRLQHVPLFQPLTEAQHIEILKHANLIEISMGEIIVKEGERTQEFYVLLVGEANLVVSLPDGSEYQDVGHLSAGAIIG